MNENGSKTYFDMFKETLDILSKAAASTPATTGSHKLFVDVDAIKSDIENTNRQIDKAARLGRIPGVDTRLLLLLYTFTNVFREMQIRNR